MDSIQEEGGDQPEPETVLSLVPLVEYVPSASDLVEVRKAGPSILLVEQIPMPGFRFLADVPPKIFFLRIVQIATAPTIPE